MWGGHKVIYIFTSTDSGEILYYNITLEEAIPQSSNGAGACPTTTIITSRNIFMPIPSDIENYFYINVGSKILFVTYELINKWQLLIISHLVHLSAPLKIFVLDESVRFKRHFAFNIRDWNFRTKQSALACYGSNSPSQPVRSAFNDRFNICFCQRSFFRKILEGRFFVSCCNCNISGCYLPFRHALGIDRNHCGLNPPKHFSIFVMLLLAVRIKRHILMKPV